MCVAVLLASFVLCASCVRVPAAETPTGDSPAVATIEMFLEIDDTIVSDDLMIAARDAAAEITPAIKRCGDEATLSTEQCLLAAILGNARLTTRPGTAQPADSTLSATLARKSGTCAALVAIVLALTEDHGAPFRAVVLRDHVLLESSRHPEVFYETLRSGARVKLDLSRREVEIAVRTDLADYVAYYLDNLAARFALVDDLETAERLFGQALDSAPDSARIHYNFGLFHRLRGSGEAGAVFLDRAYELGWPRDPQERAAGFSLLD